ncbi:hypothetical protein PL111_1012 [Leuconostoc inhae]|uniref:Uncharacterized protein n=1 Tax=Leuconostoc inhae TaxID=178001 RepID=A0AAN2QWJ6_9LACO|nr:hypothetical protein KSL4_1792 [Leuconostoc inhae]CUW19089.1 hypothetical protein PL111_1012 [Leuconostoc inhae]
MKLLNDSTITMSMDDLLQHEKQVINTQLTSGYIYFAY